MIVTQSHYPPPSKKFKAKNRKDPVLSSQVRLYTSSSHKRQLSSEQYTDTTMIDVFDVPKHILSTTLGNNPLYAEPGRILDDCFKSTAPTSNSIQQMALPDSQVYNLERFSYKAHQSQANDKFIPVVSQHVSSSTSLSGGSLLLSTNASNLLHDNQLSGSYIATSAAIKLKEKLQAALQNSSDPISDAAHKMLFGTNVAASDCCVFDHDDK